ncbi:MAG: PilZ domain-containing protein [Acidobacteriota bacterium]
MKTVLIQDDPVLFRDLEDSLLQRAGVRLLVAGTPDDLAALSLREGPDLVILGQGPPGPNPEKILRRLRALPAPPACLVSPRPPEPSGLLELLRARLDLPDRGRRRRVCRVKALARCGSQDRVGVTRDLSEDGVFVATAEPYEERQEVELRIAGRTGHREVAAAGRVVRSVVPVAGLHHLPGMAVRFHETSRLRSEMVDLLAGSSPGQESAP